MALEVRGLHMRFAGVHALRGVDFSVDCGSCVALIGPNGAGKSTTFACIAGQCVPSAGTVSWSDQSLAGLTPAQRLRQGVARTFQVAQIFDALPVWHNLALVLQASKGLSAWRALAPGDAALQQQVQAALAQVGLSDRVDAMAGDLAYGDRKRLELALALGGLLGCGSGAAQAPRLLLLDEPAAGLAASERHALMQVVRSLAHGSAVAAPLAVLYTEHNMDAVFGVADRVLVLMEGRLVAQGDAASIANNAMVQQRYLGRALSARQESGHA